MCAYVIYLVMTTFVVVQCSSDYCVFRGDRNEEAFCRNSDTGLTLDFIPPISEYITYITLNEQQVKELPYNAFHNISSFQNITHILCYSCQINYINSDAFLNLNNLIYLDLYNNSIPKVDGRTFQPIKQIKYIGLAKNKIKEFPKDLFANLLYLEMISMHSNQIEIIDADAFKNTSSLRYIDLGHNKLSYLDLSVIHKFANVAQLYLHDNPWNCDCRILELRHLFQQVSQDYKYSMPQCRNPSKFRGKQFYTINSAEFTCDPQIIMPMNNTEVVVIGENVTLSCEVHGRPKPDMNWYKDSVIIEPQYLSSSSYRYMHYLNYTFTAHENNAGVFYCIANYSQIRQESKITLGVYRKIRKKISTSTESLATTIETLTTIVVPVTTTPQPVTISELTITSFESKTENSRWMAWMFVFIGICSAVGMITGLILGTKFVLRKCRKRRHVQLPTIVRRKSTKRRSRTRNRERIMSVIYSATHVSASNSEESSAEEMYTQPSGVQGNSLPSGAEGNAQSSGEQRNALPIGE